MAGETNKDMDKDLKISIILRGAIAVVVGGVTAMLMFVQLTRSTLIVSYRLGEVSLESAAVALFDEIMFSLLAGIAFGVIALIIVYWRFRVEGGKEQ